MLPRRRSGSVGRRKFTRSCLPMSAPSRLKVRDLLHAVGKKCGVEPGVIDALDLENVVERTIAIQVCSLIFILVIKIEGRERTTGGYER